MQMNAHSSCLCNISFLVFLNILFTYVNVCQQDASKNSRLGVIGPHQLHHDSSHDSTPTAGLSNIPGMITYGINWELAHFQKVLLSRF
jgi:hypothetical protein